MHVGIVGNLHYYSIVKLSALVLELHVAQMMRGYDGNKECV